MKALIRFLRGDPTGHAADGRSIGVGLSAALKKHHSAEKADHYLRLWSANQSTRKSPRA